MSINLIDTPGVSLKSNDLLSSSMKSSYIKTLESIDMLLLMIDIDNKDFNYEESILKLAKVANTEIIILINKIDLVAPSEKLADAIPVSALFGDGISDLKNTIKNKLISKNTQGSDTALTTRRQEIAITSCKNSLSASLKYLNKDAPELEIVAYELRDSINHIDTLMGKTTVDDILNKVFSGFCVGK